MGAKIKQRQARKPRNYIARAMILEKIGVNACKPMKHRCDSRSLDRKNSWVDEEWFDENEE